MWLRQIFVKLFKISDSAYDESSDCFEAMKVALKQYEEDYGWLNEHRKAV